MLKSIVQSVVQDMCVSGAVWLAAHGFITNAQTQEFEGAAFFIGMLIFNAAMQRLQTKEHT